MCSSLISHLSSIIYRLSFFPPLSLALFFLPLTVSFSLSLTHSLLARALCVFRPRSSPPYARTEALLITRDRFFKLYEFFDGSPVQTQLEKMLLKSAGCNSVVEVNIFNYFQFPYDFTLRFDRINIFHCYVYSVTD